LKNIRDALSQYVRWAADREARRLDAKFEHRWTSEAKMGPIVGMEADAQFIDSIKRACRRWFGYGYQQRNEEEAGND
jgi:hypothetical protein